jgi:hypothetical protein
MNGKEFEEFDVKAEGFEEFDVTVEAEPEPEVSVEALGGLAETEDELRSVSQARDELEKRLMLEPGEAAFAAAEEGAAGYGNVVGVGIGEKEVNGSPTGQLVVKVFVKEKLASEDVASEALVPKSIGSVKTDVDATGEISSQMFTARLRPAPCGVSIGNCNRVMAGTLGCLVTRANQLFILSNNHVMALVNTSPLNAGIPQPGRLDGGVCPADIIARLTQFIPINFAATASNVVDAAIARTSPNLVDRRVLRPGGVRQPLAAPIVAPALNQLVQKSGRTTQFRRGTIDAINVTVNVNYAPLGGVARFVNQFRVRGIGGIFSDRGDSGSLVTTSPQNRPVGLLFAGNAASNTTFCNDIRRVLAAFGVSIVF